MFGKADSIQDFDAELWAAIVTEDVRQEQHIELIASENYTSACVMQAQGTALTNKYAEGYPGKRYYGGCEHVDKVESLGIERARMLFDADYGQVERLALEHRLRMIVADVVTTTTHKTLRGPLMHVIAAKAVAFKEALDPEFKIYRQQVLDNIDSELMVEEVKQKVLALCRDYPVCNRLQAPRSSDTQSGPYGHAIRTGSTATSSSGGARPLFGE